MTPMPPRNRPATATPIAGDGRQRVVIEHLTPCVDGGRFPVKRVLGEPVVVQADIF
ncbi:maltotransferase domain-containing protein, partial [Immundisolibacter sp.]|uniref:maltotransferase domain-containing protein n=1 Tax=Immundisolibacter sp. TaxID=1934948 RepID=UPI0034588CA8